MPRGPGYLSYGELSKAEEPTAPRSAPQRRHPADFFM
jgi:hypothetical protein